MASTRNAAFVALAALLTLSGACGLAFELIWVKLLSLALGQTTLAVSLIVAAFLGGLVLGSLSLGQLADRVRRPLRAYAAMTLSAGVLSLGATWLMRRLPEALGGGPLALRMAIAALVVLPPTFAMGGTIPAAVRFATRSLSSLGRSFGTLYSVDRLGAALGCVLTGFVLIGWLGLFRTAVLAASVEIAGALLALLLDGLPRNVPPPVRPEPVEGPESNWRFDRLSANGMGMGHSANGDYEYGRSPRACRGVREPNSPTGEQVLLPDRARRLLVAALALSGFASMAYEVLWFRVLSSSLESSVYALALLLATSLLGLVLGGLLYSALYADRPQQLELFAAVQALAALVGLLSMIVVGQQRALEHLVPPLLASLPRGARYLAMALRISTVVLVPATVLGVSLPFAVQLTAKHLHRVGAHVGLLYSVNTLGGIAGALATGLWLIPALGTQRAFGAACAASMAVALAATWIDPGARRRARLCLAAATVPLLAAFVMLPRDYLVSAQARFSDSRVLDVREGRDGTIAVLEYDQDTVCGSGLYACDARCDRFSHRQLLFGSIPSASTVVPARRHLRALAHLPMLLTGRASRVLELGFGTGTAAGAFTTYPSLATLELVDPDEDVFALAPKFEESNRGVLSDPRAHVRVDDARHFLRTTAHSFDVISLEPPPPRTSGASNVYSREFYALAQARLAGGGVLAQWIPLDQQGDALSRMLIRAVLDVFPHAQLWVPSRLDGVILASDRPLRADLARWRALFAEPAIGESLAEVGFGSPEELAGAFVLGDAALRRYADGVPPITDDLPKIEYFLSARGRRFSAAALLLGADDVSKLLDHATDDEVRRAREHSAASRRFIVGHVLGRLGERNLAWDQVELASQLVGDSIYTDYLKNFEYGCLAHKQPGGPSRR